MEKPTSHTDTAGGGAPRIRGGGSGSAALILVLAGSPLVTVGGVDRRGLTSRADDALALLGRVIGVGSRLVDSL